MSTNLLMFELLLPENFVVILNCMFYAAKIRLVHVVTEYEYILYIYMAI